MEKVVATMETPKSHHGMLRPPRKNSEELFPADFDAQSPMPSETIKKAPMIAQSMPPSFISAIVLYIDISCGLIF